MSETDTFDTGLAKATHKSAARLVEVNWFNSRYVALMCVYSSVCKLVLHEPLKMTLKRCLLCLTTSRSDTLWPGNKVLLLFFGCAEDAEAHAIRYRSLPQSPRNGLRYDLGLEEGLLIPQGSCLHM